MNPTSNLHPLATHSLEDGVEALAWLKDTSDPVVSIYFTLDQPGANLAKVQRQALETIRNMNRHSRDSALTLLKSLENHLLRLPKEEDLSLAFFLREGEQPCRVAVTFPGKVETMVRFDRQPSIFELVERKDVYQSYAIVNLTSTSAKIFQVNAGRVTESILAGHLDLRSNVSRKISRERYHHHQQDRGQRFFKEKVKVLESIVKDEKVEHIILAGEPRLTSSFRKMLPKALGTKVLDESVEGRHTSFEAILKSSMETFMKEEEKESSLNLDRWKQSMAMGGLAIAGAQEVTQALERGNLDLLLLSKHTPLSLGDPISLKAVQNDVVIETVEDEDLLLNHQGIAGFLRYRDHSSY
jgi:protein required for attachment to host cells